MTARQDMTMQLQMEIWRIFTAPVQPREVQPLCAIDAPCVVVTMAVATTLASECLREKVNRYEDSLPSSLPSFPSFRAPIFAHFSC